MQKRKETPALRNVSVSVQEKPWHKQLSTVCVLRLLSMYFTVPVFEGTLRRRNSVSVEFHAADT